MHSVSYSKEVEGVYYLTVIYVHIVPRKGAWRAELQLRENSLVTQYPHFTEIVLPTLLGGFLEYGK